MPLNNFGILSENVARCAQPDEHGLKAARAMGFTVIGKLNTRQESDDGEEARQFGATDGRQVIQFPDLSSLSPDAGRIREIAEEVIRLEGLGAKILLHCTIGRDRSGMVGAGYRLIKDKWPIEKVLEEFKAYGEAIWPMAHQYREAIRRLDAELRAETI